MKNRAAVLRAVTLVLLLLGSAASYAQTAGLCPASHQPLPTTAERQHTVPAELLRCFLSVAEIDLVRSSIGHDAQTTVSDPAFASGELNPDGSLRPPLSAAQTVALSRMHAVLAADMHTGAIIRKFVQNSDVGGILYGRTVITTSTGPLVVTTNTVRGFVGLERNTQGLDAGASIGALGLDYETTPTGQFTDATADPLFRQVSQEVVQHGLHSIRHIMSRQGAADAWVPMAGDLFIYVRTYTPELFDHSFEMNRQGQANPYTGLGISDDIGLLIYGQSSRIYPLHLNEEDVMQTPTPLVTGDLLLRRTVDGTETRIARYVQIPQPDGSVANAWRLFPGLSAADLAYYQGLIQQAAERVAGAGG